MYNTCVCASVCVILHWNNGINCFSWIKIIGICMIAWSLFECENNKTRYKKSVNYVFNSWLFVFMNVIELIVFNGYAFFNSFHKIQFIDVCKAYYAQCTICTIYICSLWDFRCHGYWFLFIPNTNDIAWFISISLLLCDLMHVFVRLIAFIQFVCEMENIVLWVTFFTCSPFYHHSFFKLIVKFWPNWIYLHLYCTHTQLHHAITLILLF